MQQTIKFLALLLVVLLTGCNDLQKKQKDSADFEKSEKELKEEGANLILNEAIKAHGGTLYDTAHYQFVFRDKTYSFNNKNGSIYKVKSTDSLGNQIEDLLQNGTFTRKLNNEVANLSEKDITKYSNALNSVIYFATLPYKLNDKAVHKDYKGETVIKGEEYDVIKVTFGEEGGGKDHDDIFMYWINKKSHYINYLAYSYNVNDGGVRFRSAYNPRTINGIRFQDYINWEAPLGTPLQQLPALFEKGELKELSKIETKDIQNLNPSNEEG